MRKHVGIYGAVKIIRQYCWHCRQHAFVLDGILQCCDRTVITVPGGHLVTKRMAQGNIKRSKPSKKAINEMLSIQKGECIYCSVPFGISYVHPQKDKLMKVSICCDHFVPFKYAQDNRDINFVLACGTCNGIKSDKMFNTIEEARSYVQYRREKKGYRKEIYIY